MAGSEEKLEMAPLKEGEMKEFDDRVTQLNLRGKIFTIDSKSLGDIEQSRIAELARKTADGEVAFVNKNPILLPYLLRYYSQGELHLPDGFCRIHLAEELKFWGIKYENVSLSSKDKVTDIDGMREPCSGTVRMRVWNMYWKPTSILVQLGLTLIWIVHFMFLYLPMVSKEYINSDYYINDDNSQNNQESMNWKLSLSLLVLILLSLWHTFLFVLCPEKIYYYIKRAHLVYPIIMALQWFPFVFKQALDGIGPAKAGLVNFVSFFLFALRIVLFFPLISWFQCGRALGKTIVQSWQPLFATSVFFSFASITYGHIMVEYESSERDSSIRDFLGSQWWAQVTLTTVGYGDLTPINAASKIIFFFCAYTGIVIMAVIFAILWQNYRIQIRNVSDESALAAVGSLSPVEGQELFEVTISGVTGRFDRNKVGPDSPLSNLPRTFCCDERVLHSVIDYHQSGLLHLPNTCGLHLRAELGNLGVPTSEVAPCCQQKLGPAPSDDVVHTAMSLRGRTWAAYYNPRCNIESVVVHIVQGVLLFTFLAVINVVAQPGKYIDPDGGDHSKFIIIPSTLEIALLVLLGAWYTFWIVICPCRIQYFIRRGNLIFLVIYLFQWVPFIADAFIGTDGPSNFYYVIVILRIARVFLFIPMFSTWSAAYTIMISVRKSLKGLLVFGLVTILLVSAIAFLVFIVENDLRDSHFRNYFDAWYYSAATLLTVGYGDYSPLSVFGKCFGMFACGLGILVLVLPKLELIRNYNSVVIEGRAEAVNEAKKARSCRDQAVSV